MTHGNARVTYSGAPVATTLLRISLVAVLLAAGWYLTGCRDATGPEPAGGLRIVAPASTLREGETLSLSVVSKVGAEPVDVHSVHWSSRDESTATVRDGVVRGVAAGVASIVAEAGHARDSLEVAVRFSSLAAGEVAVRLQRSGAAVVHASGFSRFTEPLTVEGGVQFPTNTYIQTSLGDPQNGSLADTVLLVSLGAAPQAGDQLLRSAELTESAYGLLPAGQDYVLYGIVDHTDPSSYDLYVSVGDFHLYLDRVELPSTPGLRQGRLAGRVSFEAAGLRVQREPDLFWGRVVGQVSDTTIRVFAEFDTELSHWLAGSVAWTATGAFQGSIKAAAGVARLTGSELSLDLGATLFSDASATTGDFGWYHLSLDNPGVGSFTVATTSPTEPSGGPAASYAALPADVRVLGVTPASANAFSKGGTVTITSYQPPTAEDLGTLEGIVELQYDFWANGNRTGKSLTLRGPVHLPVLRADQAPSSGTVAVRDRMDPPGR